MPLLPLPSMPLAPPPPPPPPPPAAPAPSSLASVMMTSALAIAAAASAAAAAAPLNPPRSCCCCHLPGSAFTTAASAAATPAADAAPLVPSAPPTPPVAAAASAAFSCSACSTELHLRRLTSAWARRLEQRFHCLRSLARCAGESWIRDCTAWGQRQGSSAGSVHVCACACVGGPVGWGAVVGFGAKADVQHLATSTGESTLRKEACVRPAAAMLAAAWDLDGPQPQHKASCGARRRSRRGSSGRQQAGSIPQPQPAAMQPAERSAALRGMAQRSAAQAAQRSTQRCTAQIRSLGSSSALCD